jgi:hypothetical protein
LNTKSDNTMNRPSILAGAAATLALLVAQTAQSQTLIGGGKSAPTFPITISQPGHYKLAANLVVPVGQSAIQVAASNVILDLDGRTISSAAPVCSGDWPALNCKTGFYAAGVSNTANHENITVRNGTITGFSHGIHLFRRSLVENVVVERNAQYGMWVGSGSVVLGARAAQNKNAGILSYQSIVKDSTSSGSDIAFFSEGGLLQNVVSHDTQWAVLSNGSAGAPPGVRESVFQTKANAYQGWVQSLGNNLCNGAGC